jgi:uncharacterized protein YjbJ (UPF0337 family)
LNLIGFVVAVVVLSRLALAALAAAAAYGWYRYSRGPATAPALRDFSDAATLDHAATRANPKHVHEQHMAKVEGRFQQAFPEANDAAHKAKAKVNQAMGTVADEYERVKDKAKEGYNDLKKEVSKTGKA